MEHTTKEKINEWLSSNITEEEKNQIESLDKTQLEDAFYKSLEFGTGGLRGIMGIGSNRINKYTIGMATQGLSDYLHKTYPDQEISVAIAYDSRHNSQFFANITADVFTANSIKVYLFDELRPTPLLSYAIRHYHCHSGVVITASHNPKEYNGYKAYWNDGAQLTTPHDRKVMDLVKKIKTLDQVNFERNNDLVCSIPASYDQLYIDQVKNVCLSQDIIRKHQDLSIVYSSIHGTGITIIPQCLNTIGFSNVNVVKKQEKADGNFPTVTYPNPEEPEAMNLAIEKATSVNAEVVMATDPDTDRVGIAVKDNNGNYVLLNGNQTGSLIIEYLLHRLNEKNNLPSNGYVVTTIVTTGLISKIAAYYDIECIHTLTGFKHIATVIRQLESERKYIAGGEESYGYLIGDFVRDKDAVSSCAIIAEMTAYAKEQGLSLYQYMQQMHRKYGLYHEELIAITKKGKKGAEQIADMMQQYRNNPPKTIAGSKVVKTIDYLSGIETNLETKKTEKVSLPSSNVIQIFTENGSKISARPSGTEPKIKFYFSVSAPVGNDYQATLDALQKRVKNIQQDMKLIG